TDIGPGRLVVAVDLHIVEAVRDLLPDIVLVVEVIAALVDIAEMDRRADIDRAGIGLLLAGYQLEQGRLAGAVRPDHADDAARRQGERKVFEQQLVAIGLADAIHLDDLATEA